MTNITIDRLRADRDRAYANYIRLQYRRHELVTRKVANEAARRRFIQRIDMDIVDAHAAYAQLDANLEGLLTGGAQ